MKNTVASIFFFFTFLLKIKFTDANMLNSHRLVGTPGAPESCRCIRSTAPTSWLVVRLLMRDTPLCLKYSMTEWIYMDLAFLSCSGLKQNPAYVFIFLCFSLSHSGAGACRASVGLGAKCDWWTRGSIPPGVKQIVQSGRLVGRWRSAADIVTSRGAPDQTRLQLREPRYLIFAQTTSCRGCGGGGGDDLRVKRGAGRAPRRRSFPNGTDGALRGCCALTLFPAAALESWPQKSRDKHP